MRRLEYENDWVIELRDLSFADVRAYKELMASDIDTFGLVSEAWDLLVHKAINPSGETVKDKNKVPWDVVASIVGYASPLALREMAPLKNGDSTETTEEPEAGDTDPPTT